MLNPTLSTASPPGPESSRNCLSFLPSSSPGQPLERAGHVLLCEGSSPRLMPLGHPKPGKTHVLSFRLICPLPPSPGLFLVHAGTRLGQPGGEPCPIHLPGPCDHHPLKAGPPGRGGETGKCPLCCDLVPPEKSGCFQVKINSFV